MTSTSANDLATPIELSEAGQNLANALATRLRNQIVSGQLLPGTKLSIDELKGDFGVSLSPLREALSRLSAEGFVVNEDKRGFRVAPVSEANLLEVATLQATLETKALRESIRNGDTRWEESVIVAHHRLTRHERPEKMDGSRVDEWESHHRRFHLTLVSACDMPLLFSMCESLQSFSARYRRLFLAYQTFDQNVGTEHQSMFEAALDRDADVAAALLKEHIERTAQNILVTFRERHLGNNAPKADALNRLERSRRPS
jgi:GntR family carbon starvation induced transcriptional regulator